MVLSLLAPEPDRTSSSLTGRQSGGAQVMMIFFIETNGRMPEPPHLRALSIVSSNTGNTADTGRSGLPAFEMPCSWSMLLLFHGLGARPA
jgi:hypothetical protein